MSAKAPRAVICGRTPLHEGFLRLYKYEFEVARHRGGVQRISWEIMERGNSVAVLGHDLERDAIVLANEFRPGALVSSEYAYLDNLVAGAIGRWRDAAAGGGTGDARGNRPRSD